MKCVVIVLSIFIFVLAWKSLAQPAEITIFAASSLTDAFTEIGQVFETRTSSRVRFQFAASSLLKTQLDQGAQADVFASASTAVFDPLVQTGLVVKGTYFAANKLIVIVPRNGLGYVKTLQDLAKPGVKLAIAQTSVPAGQYARKMLNLMTTSGAYGENFSARVLKNVVSEEVNVRMVVLKVQLNEADAGIVYATDMTPALMPVLTRITIPTQYNIISPYPISVLRSAPNPDIARAFVQFVQGLDGQRILAKWGFLKPIDIHLR